jgi:hypothetical protein
VVGGFFEQATDEYIGELRSRAKAVAR